MDRPFGLLAELTYRCPLACAYCSNPLELAAYDDEMSTAEGQRVFTEAARQTLPLPRASVREDSLETIWDSSPMFTAFRGTDWMQDPCRTCERRELDFGGCRCQAFQLTGRRHPHRPGLPSLPRPRDRGRGGAGCQRGAEINGRSPRPPTTPGPWVIR